MDPTLKATFAGLWKQYFPGADLPVCCWYADRPGDAKAGQPVKAHRCVMADVARVRRGARLALDADAIGCFGGKRYLGFPQELGPDFEYFLSSGIPGKLEGERYKATPELVLEWLRRAPAFAAPARFIILKRWDALAEADQPEVVIFFAPADVLSGLFTLANFDEAEHDGVIAPMGAGCATIVQWPFLEGRSARPRAVLGTFDVSARPFVAGDVLSFAAPIAKFLRMVANMSESFLITPSWAKVRERLARLGAPE